MKQDLAQIEQFLDALWLERNLAENTLSAYRRDLTMLVEWLHHRGLTLASVGSDDLQALLAERQTGKYAYHLHILSSSGKEMLVDKTHSSTPPESHESRFHKEEFPFFWVVNVYARYTQLMEIELKKIDIDLSRFRVLMLVHQYHRASISRITEYAVSKMPTVTKIVGRLRDDGLLTTHVSVSDGRG